MKSKADEKGYNQEFCRSPAVDVRLERRLDLIVDRLGDTRGTKILEIGCGTGRAAYMLVKKTGAYIIAVDISEKFISQARVEYQHPNLEFRVMDITKNDFAGGEGVDSIVGNGILHHVYRALEDVLRAIRHKLKDGGKMIFWEPNIFNPYCAFIFKNKQLRRMCRLEPGEMAFSKRFIAKQLMRVGFKNISIEYRDFLLPVTPAGLIAPVISIGAIAEKVPIVNKMAQSIFIYAEE